MSSKLLAFGASFALAMLLGCEGPAVAPIPAFADGGLLRLGDRLPQASHVPLEGRFLVSEGTNLLGEDVVLTTGRNTITLSSGKEAAVVALEGACLQGDRLILEGHWRYPRGREVGLVRLELSDDEAARDLCAGSPTTRPLHFEGNWSEGSDALEGVLELTFAEPLIPYRGRFFSVAHHGACEPSDSCGVAPNTLETILLSERYGATAMEVDVRVTQDGVPILFHDPIFNSSSTRGAFCQGPVESQTFDQVQANCRLTYGEKIATVEQALDLLLDDTLMEFAYLDLKVPEAVAATAELAAAINARADALGRGFRAVVALTKDSVTQEWLKFVDSAADVPPCLVEYDPILVGELGCVAWGPTWTAGPRTEDVETVRAAGARVIYWTLNDDNFMRQFLSASNPDGAITARTGLLMYLYQKAGQVPPEPENAMMQASFTSRALAALSGGLVLCSATAALAEEAPELPPVVSTLDFEATGHVSLLFGELAVPGDGSLVPVGGGAYVAMRYVPATFPFHAFLETGAGLFATGTTAGPSGTEYGNALSAWFLTPGVGLDWGPLRLTLGVGPALVRTSHSSDSERSSSTSLAISSDVGLSYRFFEKGTWAVSGGLRYQSVPGAKIDALCLGVHVRFGFISYR